MLNDSPVNVLVSVLDQGFVRCVDKMGDDNAVVQAARVSYGHGTKLVSEDEGLIRYLLKNHHMTPFEMAYLKLHVKLPIFIARQWMRHRSLSYNEVSARYSELSGEFYIPQIEDIKKQSTKNKQGSEAPFEDDEARFFQTSLVRFSAKAFYYYSLFLKKGVARETSREILPVNVYTEFYVSGNLRNWLHFLNLRLDSHAQFEMREYANAIAEIVKEWLPLTWKAFEDYHLNAVTLSEPMLDVVRRRLTGECVTGDNCGLSKREWEELEEILVGKEKQL